jgi:large subunit ribosomal protein L24
MEKTTQGRKQRRRFANLSLHQKHSQLSALLSPDMRKRFQRRNLPIKRGDKVKVICGSDKGKEGEVMKVDLKNLKIFIDKVVSKKRDGTEVLRPMDSSNLMITELNLSDKMRQRILERKVSSEVVEEEVRREEAKRKADEERRLAEEAKKKAELEAKKKAEEAKKQAKTEKTPAKKETRTETQKVAEKGIDKQMKKEWIKEK